jgi:hypothetical protein
MSGSFFSRPWTEQPQDAAGVDWSNPLTAGLLRLLLPIGGRMVDVMGGSVTQIGCVARATPSGIAITNNGESISGGSVAPSNYISLPVLAAGPVSTLFGGIRFSTPGASRVSALFSTGGNADTAHEIDAGNAFGDANLVYFYAYTGTATNPLLYSDGVLAVGTNPTNKTITNRTPFVLLGSYSNASAGPTNRMFCAANAAFNATSVYAHDVGAFIFAQWSRQLTPAESIEVTRNPWQLFAPRRIYIPTAVAAGGLPTLTSLGISGITTTGAILTTNA